MQECELEMTMVSLYFDHPANNHRHGLLANDGFAPMNSFRSCFSSAFFASLR